MDAFSNTNALVGFTAYTTTHAFHVHVAYERVAHLFVGKLWGAGPNTFTRTDDGTDYTIVAVPVPSFHKTPPMTTLEDKTFTGHHHELVRHLLKLPPLFDTSYLHALVWHQ